MLIKNNKYLGEFIAYQVLMKSNIKYKDSKYIIYYTQTSQNVSINQ